MNYVRQTLDPWAWFVIRPKKVALLVCVVNKPQGDYKDGD